MTRTIQETLSSNNDPSVQYVETVEAYNKWAQVYDTDGNFLQALDTIEMRRLLPAFLDKVTNYPQPSPLKLVDLGCGTGRNTLQLLHRAPRDAHIVGLDASPGMLDIARDAVRKATDGEQSNVALDLVDLRQTPLQLPECSRGAAAVLSTLVLEHIPLGQFFGAAAELLRPGGYLLVTNMHSEMGALSQAGFVDPVTGTKIRPTSYSHTVAETLAAAEAAGFLVEDLDGESVRERTVDAALAEVLGKRAAKWVGVTVWYGVCFRKKV
ncbi:S-adenosyl-L-methionine-dependent methyltransferase [Aspergillus ambiguus]|uniref:class I SAM-dependent DNA methyltransferase n=1 Tax=Aspergillus ambiguus TaxID=176160 RepID=UPI003CCD414A